MLLYKILNTRICFYMHEHIYVNSHKKTVGKELTSSWWFILYYKVERNLTNLLLISIVLKNLNLPLLPCIGFPFASPRLQTIQCYIVSQTQIIRPFVITFGH